MKKVMGFIIMVMVLVMVAFVATAAEVSSEHFTILEEYLKENDLMKYKEGYIDGFGVFCGSGIVDTEAFETLYDCEFTQENIEQVMTELYNTEFAVLLAKVGKQNGTDIYSLQFLAQMDLMPGLDGTQVAVELLCILV